MSYGEPIALRGQIELEQVATTAPATTFDARESADAQLIESLSGATLLLLNDLYMNGREKFTACSTG